MRFIRALTVAAGIAVGLALSSGPALAAHGTAVEVGPVFKLVAHSESGSETLIRAHMFGIEQTASQCAEEFTVYLGASGSGHVTDQVLTGANCTKQPCAGAEGDWPFHLAETGTDQEVMELRLCWEELDGTSPIHCSLELGVDAVARGALEFSATDQRCHAVSGTPPDADVEVTGHWITEFDESDSVEVVHH